MAWASCAMSVSLLAKKLSCPTQAASAARPRCQCAIDEAVCTVQAIAASPKGAVNGYAIGSYLYLGIVSGLVMLPAMVLACQCAADWALHEQVYIFPMGLGLGGLCLDLPVRHVSCSLL